MISNKSSWWRTKTSEELLQAVKRINRLGEWQETYPAVNDALDTLFDSVCALERALMEALPCPPRSSESDAKGQ